MATPTKQTKKEFRYGVVLGRFQPFHNGHLAMLRNALEKADNLIVVVGSHEATHTTENPWSSTKRIQMILDSITADEANRITFRAAHDHLYKDRDWVSEVRQIVEHETADSESVTLVGHDKDHTSYYLSLFPDWNPTFLPIHFDGLSATHIREALFEDRLLSIQDKVPEGVYRHLCAFLMTTEYQSLLEDYKSYKEAKADDAKLKYQPFYQTADAVVTCSDYVLLIKRGKSPGRGLWAIPGGFVNPNERIEAAAWRELNEETGLGSTGLVSLKGSHVFDHPKRSLRGRLITTAYHFETQKLHAVEGSDDAADARWFPIHKLKSIRSQFFDDHFFILEHFLGKL